MQIKTKLKNNKKNGKRQSKQIKIDLDGFDCFFFWLNKFCQGEKCFGGENIKNDVSF